MSQNSKIVPVTGTSKGVGHGIPLGLAKGGWNVGVNTFKDSLGSELTAEAVHDVGQDSWLLIASG